MTNWLPIDLPGEGPIYVRLADRLESDITNGALPPGTKLPPQRDLAYDLGVTIGTIGRAYALARKRGLIAGEVGRGTYVRKAKSLLERPPEFPSNDWGTHAPIAPAGVVRFDSTSAALINQTEIQKQVINDILSAHPDEVASYTRRMRPEWQLAGRQWLSTPDWTPDPESIVPTMGGHAAAVATILGMTSPGDLIIVEDLSYASFGRTAALLGRRVSTVRTDEEGIDVEELGRICAQQHPRALFLMPSLNNPTLTTLGLERRKTIASLARKHNMWLIEDGIYTSLVGDPHPGLAALAPECTFSFGGLSKSFAAGVRGGWLACPPGYVPRLIAAHKMATGGLPYLLTELASQLVHRGLAELVREHVRAENEARRAIIQSELDGLTVKSKPNAPFVWVALPSSWPASQLKKALENENVLVDDADEFQVGRRNADLNHIRIGFSAPVHRHEVERGAKIIGTMIRSGSPLYDSYN